MRRLALAAGLALLVAPGSGRAHWLLPGEVIDHIAGGEVARRRGVLEARRDETVPRLLIVRVGPAWQALPAAERRALAEAWQRAWRDAVPHGLLGVVDAASGAAVVNFDANGQARVAPAPEGQDAPSMNSVKP